MTRQINKYVLSVASAHPGVSLQSNRYWSAAVNNELSVTLHQLPVPMTV